MGKHDPPTSVLTGRQRSFLRGESDLTPSGERSIRQHIRDRLHTSIFDIQHIVSNLNIKDIDKALSETDDFEPTAGDDFALASSMDTLAALLFLFVADAVRDAPDEQAVLDSYLQFVASGIETAAARRGHSIETLDLDGTLEYGTSLDELADQELATLSRDELKQLLMADKIDSDEFAKAITAKQE